MTSQFMEVMLRSSGLPYCIQLSRFSCSMPLWPSQDSVRAVPACRRCDLCTLDRKLRLTTKMFNPVNKRQIEVFFTKGSKHSFISSFVYIG